jgi:molybdate transport system ATP-binding protein
VNGEGLDARLRLRRGDSFQLDLSLSIPPGSTVALLGPNGAGKSTAVAALAGLLPLDRGRITLAGATLDDPERDLFVPPEARNLGVVFQDYLLFPHLTVIENVAFGLRSRRVGREESRARAGDWLGRLGLSDLARRRPGALSGGQAQRVALARALVTEPDLLLLDEPLTALDVTTRVELRRTLAEHLETFAGPRLLITHDATEAFLLADEIHVIEHGVVTQAGTADDIRLRPRTPYAADLAGSNLVRGVARGGVVDTGSHLLHIARHHISGPVLATIRPSAISVHRREPEGSPRNTWRTSIDLIEDLGETVRLRTGPPLPLTAEITADAARALDLAEGATVWISIKATEVMVELAHATAQDGLA